jgi:hypothetical protein
VEAVIALGAGLSDSAGAEHGVKRESLWQMEACVHLLSGVPGVIAAATASGDIDDDKMVAACRVMEECMCYDATCAALMWLFALPSAGALNYMLPGSLFSQAYFARAGAVCHVRLVAWQVISHMICIEVEF